MAARLPRSNAIIIKATSDRHEPTVPHLSCPVNDLRGVTGGTPRQRVSLALAAIASPVESGQSTDVGSSAEARRICKQTPRVPMQPPPLSTAAQPTNGPSASAAAAAAAARPMEAESKAAVRPPDMAEAVIDLSSYDWLAFPYWAKALELNNFPKFLLWLTEQDAMLAGTVAMRQEEFELVFSKIKREMETEPRTTAAQAQK